jgi:D-threonine aldolase
MKLPPYPLVDADRIPSPAFVVWNHLLAQNLDEMLAIAGSPARLRPHCKTHKTREVVRLLLDRGVVRHKAATLREAALCIEAGSRDVVLAYQMIGPNVEQFVSLAASAPDAQLTATVDNEAAAQWLSDAAAAQGVTVGAMVDLDTGLHRTGLPVGEEAYALYQKVQDLPGLRPAGLHVYDAQNNKHTTFEEREAAVAATLAPVCKLVTELQNAGCDVPELLCGGSATFPCYARYAGPIICSPGTTVFWDYNNSQNFPDLNAYFRPAALLLARVVSRPTPQHVTLDLGNKAIASDPPQGKRGLILGLEDAVTTLHNEEHWTVTSERAGNFKVGDPLLVIPSHVCPNANLYPLMYVVDQDGRLCDRWEVVARQRPLVL